MPSSIRSFAAALRPMVTSCPSSGAAGNPTEGHRADVLGDIDDREDVAGPHAVLLEEREQPRVLLGLLGDPQDRHVLAGPRLGERSAGRPLGRATVARDRVAVRAGRRAAEELVDLSVTRSLNACWR